MNANGGFQYQPNSGFQGTDSFRFLASDGLFSDEAEFFVDVVAAPIPTVSISTSSTVEGFTDYTQTHAATYLGALEGNLVTFTVTVTPLVEGGAIAEAITVKYKTADAVGAPPKAIAGEDYTATSGTLVFEAGAMGEALTKTFTVATTHDETVEPDERFWAGLTSATGAKMVVRGAEASVRNNDVSVALSTDYAHLEAIRKVDLAVSA